MQDTEELQSPLGSNGVFLIQNRTEQARTADLRTFLFGLVRQEAEIHDLHA